jgi:hypothetical protein
MRHEWKYGAALLLSLAAGGCASAPVGHPAQPFPSGYSAATAPTPTLHAPAAARRGDEDERQPGGDIPGLLRNTVGFVVPMPGTEMVRMGVVQEGATLQATNRAPSVEALGGGTPAGATAATLIIRILPPAQQ